MIHRVFPQKNRVCLSWQVTSGVGALFLFIFVLFSCQRTDSGESNQRSEESLNSIRLSQISSIILDPGEEMIGKFREKMHVNSDETILTFVDDLRSQLFLFDSDGILIRVIGRTGSGPEEFLKISGFFLDEKNRLIVIDESQLLVKVFNLNGDLVTSFPIFENQSAFIASRNIYVHDDMVYIQIYEPSQAHDKKNSKLIARYHLSGDFIDLIGKFDPHVEDSNHYLLGHNFTVDPEKNLLLSNLETSPNIQVFTIPDVEFSHNIRGRSAYWNLGRERIEPSMPRSEIMKKAVGNTYSQGLFFLDDYIVHHIQETTHDWFFGAGGYLDKKNYAAFYDRETMEYIGSVELNGYLGSATDNRLYVVESFDPENFKISVYEISVN